MSSRTSGRREPSPGPTPPSSSSSSSGSAPASSSRPASLRQAPPLRTPPQLLNGKGDAAQTPGRTRSSLRHSTHSPPLSSHAAAAGANAGAHASASAHAAATGEVVWMWRRGGCSQVADSCCVCVFCQTRHVWFLSQLSVDYAKGDIIPPGVSGISRYKPF